MRIRRALLHDVPAVRRLLRDSWHDTYDWVMGPDRVEEISSKWHCEERLSAQVSDGEIAFLVADEGGHVLGHACGVLEEDIVTLERLYILPGEQGRGIGPLLLAELAALFPGAGRMRACVFSDNRRGRRFYAREGFEETGETVEGGLPHVSVEKRLRPA
jgi:GNAT superfamily N-acetyltransferase